MYAKNGSLYLITVHSTILHVSNMSITTIIGNSGFNNYPVIDFGAIGEGSGATYQEGSGKFNIPLNALKKAIGKHVLVSNGSSIGKTGKIVSIFQKIA